MNKNNTIAVVGLILVSIVLLLFVFGVFKLPSKQQLTPTSKSTITPTPELNPLAANTGKNAQVPIGPNHPSVGLLLLSYSLNGTIGQTTTNGDVTMLNLKTKGKQLPDFPITAATKINNISSDGKIEPVGLSFLKTGARVNLQAQFNVVSKTWTVNSVNILPGAGRTSVSPTPAKTTPSPVPTK